ncbi:DNA polymerase III subunit chi [uncultured Paracoccus sp.]|uniref:DNA polymerase III subunit chi n=1 Tax=uncultured Paracoccus sp. TaxID=189685 RepID=UPI0026301ADB|nr:DNA polymerase III subunit chi [uncultured Paracoccus sp.]
MGNALFYHLTRSPAESLLPALIGKSRAAGWRIELRGADQARMQRLDELLWQGEGFLPHGLAGGPHDARQPVLLTIATGAADGTAPDDDRMAPNDPACLIIVDGAAVRAEECVGMDRVCILFDGNDPAAVEQARGQWRALTAAGLTAEYWSEADGRWERKA